MLCARPAPGVAGEHFDLPVRAGVVHADRGRLPVLIVHNRGDGCTCSPPSGAERAMAMLIQAPARQLVMVSGGRSRSRACGAMSPHGYLGIEDLTVTSIVTWIRAH